MERTGDGVKCKHQLLRRNVPHTDISLSALAASELLQTKSCASRCAKASLAVQLPDFPWVLDPD